MGEEIWRDIPETKGAYSVSSFGRVRSNPRIIIRSNGRQHSIRERVLVPSRDGCGYLRCAIVVAGKLVTYKVHRLVATAFCDKPHGKYEVNHINGVKDDNRAENLEWCNRSENIKHGFKIGIHKPRVGSSNNKAKLSEDDIPKIRRMFSEGMSSRQIAKIYGMDKTVFLDIKNKKIWRHVDV